MGVFRASIRNESVILFVISAIVFLIGFGQAIFAIENTAASYSVAGVAIGARAPSLRLFLSGTLAALNSVAAHLSVPSPRSEVNAPTNVRHGPKVVARWCCVNRRQLAN